MIKLIDHEFKCGNCGRMVHVEIPLSVVGEVLLVTATCIGCGKKHSAQATVDVSIDGASGSIFPSAQMKKVKRLIEDGWALGSVLLHKTEGHKGSTAIVSPHGHVETAR